MNVFPSKNQIREIALILNTEPQFLEKDLYVCHVLKALSEHTHDHFEPIFCGGTSLLHGYQAISRFSEDVDFRIISRNGKSSSRKERRAYREDLLDVIAAHPDISLVEGSTVSRDESNFFSVLFAYPKHFEDHSSIRPQIKLEGTFEDATLVMLIEKTIKPVIGEYIAVDCITTIRCLSLDQTAADKISALSWRVINRQRGDDDLDPAVIRHLYDIHGLSQILYQELPKVLEMAKGIYLSDSKRRGGSQIATLPEAIRVVLGIFNSDPSYEKEYDQYVSSMCFGQSPPPDFNQALEAYKSLVEK